MSSFTCQCIIIASGAWALPRSEKLHECLQHSTVLSLSCIVRQVCLLFGLHLDDAFIEVLMIDLQTYETTSSMSAQTPRLTTGLRNSHTEHAACCRYKLYHIVSYNERATAV